MRHITILFCTCLLCIILCSCSSNHSEDVYFLHAAVFSKNNNGNFEVSAILEKLSGNNGKDGYFTTAQSGKDIDEITEKLSDKYKDCYFATCEVYLFDSSITKGDLRSIAKAICDSNDYPSKSLACFVSGTDVNEFTKAIKNEEDMKKLLSLIDDKKVNIVHFLSCIYSEEKTEIPSLTVRNGKTEKSKNKTYFGKGDKYEA